MRVEAAQASTKRKRDSEEENESANKRTKVTGEGVLEVEDDGVINLEDD